MFRSKTVLGGGILILIAAAIVGVFSYENLVLTFETMESQQHTAMLMNASSDAASSHVHMDDHEKQTEHMAAMRLLLPADATHYPVQSGNWSQASTWHNGQVPDAEADVFIQQGLSIAYDVNSNTKLSNVHIDGELHFATNQNTRMYVDTLVAAPTSVFTMGTIEQPMQPNVTAEVIIRDLPAIDTDEDPVHIGRGVILHGKVAIHGAKKESYLPIATPANGSGVKRLNSGTTQIPLQGDLSNWRVGDQVIVMGTERDRFQDEERTITDISGNTITLNRGLTHVHQTPAFQTDNASGIDELDIYVGNATRNVRFASEDDNQTVRGHFMVMHAPGADIRYAEFRELGRTDKSRRLNSVADPQNIDQNNNVEGRYPLHIHRTGTAAGSEPAIVIGNAVIGGPGWGIVQHDTFAAINYNFVYDILGAGIVSEDGNEIGEWIGNFVTGIKGDGEDFSVDRDEQGADFGHSGEAYNVQARHMLFQDNIAANAEVGWMFHTANSWGPNGAGSDPIHDVDKVTIFPPDPRHLQYNVDPMRVQDSEEASFVYFDDNEVIAANLSFDSGHRQTPSLSWNDLKQTFNRYKQWNSGTFNIFNYTGTYIWKDSLIIGDGGTPIFTRIPQKSQKNSFVDSHFENFNSIVKLSSALNNDGIMYNVSTNNVDELVEGNDGPGGSDILPLITGAVTPIGSLQVDLGAYPSDGPRNPSLDLTLSPNDTKYHVLGRVRDSFGWQYIYNAYWIDFGKTNDVLETRSDQGWNAIGDDFHALNKSAYPDDRGGEVDSYETTRVNGVTTPRLFPAKRHTDSSPGYFSGNNDLYLDLGFEQPGLFELWGVYKKANGQWVMPVPFWHGDRLTGEPFAYLVDFQLSGFSDSELAPYELTSYPNIVQRVDVFNPNINADGSMKSTRTYAIEPWRVAIPTSSDTTPPTPPTPASNIDPVADHDNFDTNADTDIINGTVLDNDSDENADQLSVTPQTVTGSQGGSFQLRADGTFDFSPGDAFAALTTAQSQVTSITYEVSDGRGGTDSAVLAVTITGTQVVTPPPTPEPDPEPEAPDSDGDGHIDANDNCPDDANTNQNDLDNDGEGDACDTDVDGDNVPDTNDNCRLIANANQNNYDNDSNGDACDNDDDNDGIDDEDELVSCIFEADTSCGEEMVVDLPVDGGGGVENADTLAVDDAAESDTDGSITFNVLHNDVGDGLVVTAVRGRADKVGENRIAQTGGKFVIEEDGTLTFTSNNTFRSSESGVTSIEYTIEGGDSKQSTATVVITRAAMDAAPDSVPAPAAPIPTPEPDPEPDAPDSDGDGHIDANDNCPDDANTNQNDLDNDGEGDACDADVDGDNVPDTTDNCRLIANANQNNYDNDSNGDACDDDDDNDGIDDEDELVSCVFDADLTCGEEVVVDPVEDVIDEGNQGRGYTLKNIKKKDVVVGNKRHELRISKEENQCDVTEFRSKTEAELQNDKNKRYPYGLFEMVIDCVDAGETVVQEIVLDGTFDTNGWELRKYNTNNQTYSTIAPDLVTYRTEGGNTIVEYQVTDGGGLDEDGLANGIIVDPVGIAVEDFEEVVENNSTIKRSSGGGSGGGGGSSTERAVSESEYDDFDYSPVQTTSQTSLPATDLFKNNISFVQSQFNDQEDVRNLEQFLNDFENESLVVDGKYGSTDNEAVKRFQRKYKREILDVWNLAEATGYVGITTRLKMNFLLQGQTVQCPVFTEFNGGLSGIMQSAEIGETQKILQELDMYAGPINNSWDAATNNALITFQETFREVMLDPWNISEGTGYKYKTTNKFLNYFAGCDTGSVFLEGVGEYQGI